MAGCLRSQNSYNSGIWTDHIFTVTEDQQKAILPLNDLSEKIYYDRRFIIDARINTTDGAEMRAWKTSKINRVSSNGVVILTFAQDRFDQNHDYIEYAIPGDPSSIIGMWADYYSSDITPVDPTEPTDDLRGEITYAGRAELKVGGGYKKFSINFFKNNEHTTFKSGSWTYTIDGADASSMLSIMTAADSDLDQNQIKCKFIGSTKYIGKILKLTYTTNTGLETSIDVNIIGF